MQQSDEVSARLPRWGYPLVGITAFVVLLLPVLRGGGLHSLISYDGAVYYAASAGLAHGRLPYQDFLLLHPPGITLALLPFSLLGRLVGDPTGMSAARLAFMVLGAVNAVLVTRLLRPVGLLGAIFGGLFYAVFYPSVFMHRTVTLEALAATCLIGSMLLASRWPPAATGQLASPLYVGLLVGVSASIKIWGLALVVPLFVWGVAVLGLRRALLIPAGAAAAGLTVCAPFFAVAPQPFWRMVVIAQWGRNPTSDGPLVRIREIIGLSILPGEGKPLLVGLGALLVLGACVLAFRAPIGRLGLLLLAVCVLVLLVTPTWALQYTGLSAVPAAVVAGCSVSALADLLPPAGFRVTAALAFAGIAAYGAAVLSQTWGSPFPGRALAAALAGTSGCVTTDQPIALIETDLLRRNLARDCPLVVDLGGYSYALPPASGTYVVRDRNQRWQRFALEYLSSGDATLPLRHRVGFGFTRQTAATVASWPVIAHVDGYSVRRPVPLPEAK